VFSDVFDALNLMCDKLFHVYFLNSVLPVRDIFNRCV